MFCSLRRVVLVTAGVLAIGLWSAGSAVAGTHWTRSHCGRAYSGWKQSHHGATRPQKNVEIAKLHAQHGCLFTPGA